MKKAASGLCALLIVIGLVSACTDSSKDRIESQQQGDRSQPSTAQPATPPTDSGSGTSASTPTPPSGSRTN